MHSLASIQRMNSAIESSKARKLARALNNPGEHPKDAEKGRKLKRSWAAAYSATKKSVS